MSYNISALIINGNLTEPQIEELLQVKLSLLSEVDFEEATSSYRDDGTIDVLQSAFGTLIIFQVGNIYELEKSHGDVLQFIISDISGTAYFEKYVNGKLARKYITSQGEVMEDIGDGVVSIDIDLSEQIWVFVDEYLQNDFTKNMFEAKFKHYKIA